MTNLRHTNGFRLKEAEVAASGSFTGYGSVFGNIDSYGDVMEPGAFASTLESHRSKGTTPKLLWQHDPAAVIGKWHEFTEDDHGLRMSGKLNLKTQKGAEAYELMKDDQFGLSIGFNTVQQDYDTAAKVNRIKQVELWEVSVVTFPANPEAVVMSVKSRPTNIRDFETAVRDVLGFSAREAKRIASSGWPALAERDVRDTDLMALAKSIGSQAEELQNLMRCIHDERIERDSGWR